MLQVTIKRRWHYHAIFRVSYNLFVALMFYCLYGIGELNFYAYILLFFPLEPALVYFNFYLLMPRLLFNRKYAFYAPGLVSSMTMAAIVNIFLNRFCVYLGSPYFITRTQFDFRSICSVSYNAGYVRPGQTIELLVSRYIVTLV